MCNSLLVRMQNGSAYLSITYCNSHLAITINNIVLAIWLLLIVADSRDFVTAQRKRCGHERQYTQQAQHGKAYHPEMRRARKLLGERGIGEGICVSR